MQTSRQYHRCDSEDGRPIGLVHGHGHVHGHVQFEVMQVQVRLVGRNRVDGVQCKRHDSTIAATLKMDVPLGWSMDMAMSMDMFSLR